MHNRGPGRRHPPSTTGLLSTGCAGEKKYLDCLFSLAGPILRIFLNNTHTDGEREPITGVWEQSPQRGSRGRAPGGRSGGQSPPEADEVFVFKTLIFNASATVLHQMM